MEIQTNTGTEVKIAVNMRCANLTMDDYDFTCDFFTSRLHVVTLTKEQMRREDASSYIAVVDTKDMMSGSIRMHATAQIPDTDCADGFRTEIATIDTGIMIKK